MHTHKVRTILCACLALIMLATALGGCGSPKASPSPEPEGTPVPTPVVTPPPPTPGATEKPVHVNGVWQTLGAGAGGTMYWPAISPHDTSIIMMGCDMTNTYLSWNGGEHFEQFNFGGTTKNYAFDPMDENIIYVSGNGLHRSKDQGNTWEKIFSPSGTVVYCAVDPTNSQVIYAMVAGSGMELYRSTDDGSTFTKIASTMETGALAKVYIDPASPGNDRKVYMFTSRGIVLVTGMDNKMTWVYEKPLYDAGWAYDEASQTTHYFIVEPAGADNAKFEATLSKSTDDMKTFTCISDGIDQYLRDGEKRDFNFICPSSQQVIYASVCNPESALDWQSAYGVVKTEDGGKTWKWVYKVDAEEAANYTNGWLEDVYGPWWGDSAWGMCASQADPKLCIVTNMGVAFMTRDGGDTWQPIYCKYDAETKQSTTTGLDVTNVYDLVRDPFNDEHLFMCCTDVGAFYSYNNGETWVSVLGTEGVPRAWRNTCYAMVFDPEVEGLCWSVWSNKHDLPRTKMFEDDITKGVGGVCISTDGGNTWSVSSQGLPENAVCTDIVVDPTSPKDSRVLYVTLMGLGVYKSSDGGKSWEQVNKGLDENNLRAWKLEFSPDYRMLFLVVTTGGSDETYVVEGALYRTTNGAQSWSPLTMPKGVRVINNLAMDANKRGRMYATGWSYPDALLGTPVGGGVWRSDDYGRTWTNVYDQSEHCYGITVDSRDSNMLYTSTMSGKVMVSRDGGENWKQVEDFRFLSPKNIYEDPNDPEKIYVASFGGGLFHGPLPK
nr:hypothetical protein [bacterium]